MARWLNTPFERRNNDESIYKEANSPPYQAKAKGRNRVVINED